MDPQVKATIIGALIGSCPAAVLSAALTYYFAMRMWRNQRADQHQDEESDQAVDDAVELRRAELEDAASIRREIRQALREELREVREECKRLNKECRRINDEHAQCRNELNELKGSYLTLKAIQNARIEADAVQKERVQALETQVSILTEGVVKQDERGC